MLSDSQWKQSQATIIRHSKYISKINKNVGKYLILPQNIFSKTSLTSNFNDPYTTLYFFSSTLCLQRKPIFKRNVFLFFFNFIPLLQFGISTCDQMSSIITRSNCRNKQQFLFVDVFCKGIRSSSSKCMVNTMLKGGPDLSLGTHHNRVKTHPLPVATVACGHSDFSLTL